MSGEVRTPSQAPSGGAHGHWPSGAPAGSGRLTQCVCMGDREPNTKRCTRWADLGRDDGLCKSCALPDAYCWDFRDLSTTANTRPEATR